MERATRIDVDWNRFDRTLKCMSRALYFHERDQKYVGGLHVRCPHIHYIGAEYAADLTADYIGGFIDRLPLFNDSRVKGENTAVFQYRFYFEPPKHAFHMRFYEGWDVIVVNC